MFMVFSLCFGLVFFFVPLSLPPPLFMSFDRSSCLFATACLLARETQTCVFTFRTFLPIIFLLLKLTSIFLLLFLGRSLYFTYCIYFIILDYFYCSCNVDHWYLSRNIDIINKSCFAMPEIILVKSPIYKCIATYIL